MSSRTVPRPAPLAPARRVVADVCRPVAFWAAVVLPVAYGPLLFGGVNELQLQLLGALVVVHLGCLVLGHDYARR